MSKCLLQCEGVFASVKKFPIMEENDDESHLIFVEGYKRYKRFFEQRQGEKLYMNKNKWFTFVMISDPPIREAYIY